MMTPISFYTKKELGVNEKGQLNDPMLSSRIAEWEMDAADLNLLWIDTHKR